MKLKATNYQKKLLKISALGGLLIVLIIAGLIYFNWQIKLTLKEIQADKTDLANRQLMLKAIQKLEEDYKKAEKDLAWLRTILPTSDHLIDLLAKMKESARANHIDQGLNFTIENQAEGKKPKSYSFVLVLNGTSNNLISYFTEIDKLPYLIQFDQIELNKSDGQANAYRLNIMGRVYIR